MGILLSVRLQRGFIRLPLTFAPPSGPRGRGGKKSGVALIGKLIFLFSGRKPLIGLQLGLGRSRGWFQVHGGGSVGPDSEGGRASERGSMAPSLLVDFYCAM